MKIKIKAYDYFYIDNYKLIDNFGCKSRNNPENIINKATVKDELDILEVFFADI